MKKQMGTLAAIVLLAGLVSSSWSQRVVDRTGAGGYEDISKRQTRSTEREDRKKREAEEAKKKAEEEKRREERRKRYESDSGRRDPAKEPAKGMTTTTGSKDTAEGKKGPRRGAAKGEATQPVTAGGSTDPTTQEVNEVILNSVKTRRVDFNENAAKKSPSMILLNKPKFDPKDRVRAGDTGMAQPL